MHTSPVSLPKQHRCPSLQQCSPQHDPMSQTASHCGGVHSPSTQTDASPVHAPPHTPQLVGSLIKSTQTPAQHERPDGHWSVQP